MHKLGYRSTHRRHRSDDALLAIRGTPDGRPTSLVSSGSARGRPADDSLFRQAGIRRRRRRPRNSSSHIRARSHRNKARPFARQSATSSTIESNSVTPATFLPGRFYRSYDMAQPMAVALLPPLQIPINLTIDLLAHASPAIARLQDRFARWRRKPGFAMRWVTAKPTSKPLNRSGTDVGLNSSRRGRDLHAGRTADAPVGRRNRCAPRLVFSGGAPTAPTLSVGLVIRRVADRRGDPCATSAQGRRPP